VNFGQDWLIVRAAASVVLPVIIWSGLIVADPTIPLMDPWHLLVDLATFIGTVAVGFLIAPTIWRKQAPLFTALYFPLMFLLLYFVGAEISVRFLGRGA
jgi:hypothetical protein